MEELKKVLIKDLTEKIKMLDGKDKVELLKLILEYEKGEWNDRFYKIKIKWYIRKIIY